MAVASAIANRVVEIYCNGWRDLSFQAARGAQVWASDLRFWVYQSISEYGRSSSSWV
jgi:hypothetical protein